MMSADLAFIVAGLSLFAGVLASKVASRYGIPALFLFLLIGMLLGSDGPGGIDFDDPELTRSLSDVALVVILFTGGLDTSWKHIRPVLGTGLTLATVGVTSTMLILGTFVWFILGSFTTFDIGPTGITWVEGLLIGAIVSSTDAAAVFSILKSSNLTLKGQLQPLLELESGSNDPMAILLTTSIVQLLISTDGFSVFGAAGSLIQQVLIGLLAGIGSGKLMVLVTRWLNLSVSSLYPIAALALLFFGFGLTSLFGGNGFLAVYVAGIVLGNSRVPGREAIASFHQALNWLMAIAMFLLLGLLAFPSQIPEIMPVGIAIALFLMFVARPISVILCLLPTKMKLAEMTFVSWVGLRGAVPIVLSTIPLTEGIEGARQIFNIVFFIVLISVLVQGLSLSKVACMLNVGYRSNNE